MGRIIDSERQRSKDFWYRSSQLSPFEKLMFDVDGINPDSYRKNETFFVDFSSGELDGKTLTFPPNQVDPYENLPPILKKPFFFNSPLENISPDPIGQLFIDLSINVDEHTEFNDVLRIASSLIASRKDQIEQQIKDAQEKYNEGDDE